MIREILIGAELYRKFRSNTASGRKYPKAWERWNAWQQTYGIDMAAAARAVYIAAYSQTL